MMKKVIICIYISLWTILFVQGRNLGPSDYSSISSCPKANYFDSVSLQCIRCPENQTFESLYHTSSSNLVPYNIDNPSQLTLNNLHDHDSCQCLPGFINIGFEGNVTCQECPPFHVASSDGRVCLKCQYDMLFDPEQRKCKQCSEGFILVDRLLNGTRLDSMSCVKCRDGTYANRALGRCVTCHPTYYFEGGKCLCPAGTHAGLDGQCVLLSKLATIPDRESSYVVDFQKSKIVSRFLHTYYRSVAHSCTFNSNRTACQMLANMCVLLHSSFDNELSSCGYYKTVFGKKAADLPDHVPWLYYDAKEAGRTLSAEEINSAYSFKTNNPNHILNFTVAKFSADGRLIGFGSLDQVWDLCSPIKNKLKDAMKFGTTFTSSCRVKVQTLWTEFDTSFYEVYLAYTDRENGSSKMYPVPVLNRNYMEDKAPVNSGGNRYRWQLTRRFFFFDNLSGQEHSTQRISSSKASVVRYVANIEIHVNHRKSSVDGLIYPPLIILTYGEVSYESYSSHADVAISMEVKYSMDFSSSERDISISVGVMSIFGVLWSLVETYSWGRRSGKVGVDLSGVVRFLLIICGNLANIFFVVMFCVCLYWTLIFKRQDVVFIFLPNSDNEFLIKQFLISAFALKFVHLCYILYGQMTLDFFLVDWEKPRAKNTIPHPHLAKKDDKKNPKLDQPISIWRLYFIANEWNEIQTLRKINLAYQLVSMLFFLKVIGFENLATYSPNSTLDLDPSSSYQAPQSYVCRFAISVSLYLVIIGVQLMFRVTVFERYIENKLQQFIDLCSMANISVFILQHSLYGYYIHGRSVHGFADSDLQTFYEQLKREEEDLCAHRGLEASSDCQTFEVITSYCFRDEYMRILSPTQLNAPATTPPQYHGGSNKSRIDSLKVELTVQAHETMKSFFEMFLQHSSPDVDYVIKDKFFLENLLDVEFQDVDDKCLFFRDQKHLFGRVLFYGQETLLIVFEILLFTLVDIVSYDFVLSAVITYAVASLIKVIRDAGGKRNLVKKTLVDQRFLI